MNHLFYDNFLGASDEYPSGYYEACVKLLNDLRGVQGIHQWREIFEEFSQKYTMDPEFWELWMK